MKCPSCGGEMFDMPTWEGYRKDIRYYLCINCVPYIRIIQYCKYRYPLDILKGNIVLKTILCCSKMDSECDVRSDAKTGYAYCPKIREMQENQASWVKKQNMEFEERELSKVRK